MDRILVPIGAISAALAVAAGAFGAHALKARLAADKLAVFETGARYQMYHALGIILIGILAQRGGSGVQIAGHFLIAGTVLFSGSLYGLALGGPRFLGPITPLGGLSFMIGWVVLAVSMLKS